MSTVPEVRDMNAQQLMDLLLVDRAYTPEENAAIGRFVDHGKLIERAARVYAERVPYESLPVELIQFQTHVIGNPWNPVPAVQVVYKPLGPVGEITERDGRWHIIRDANGQQSALPGFNIPASPESGYATRDEAVRRLVAGGLSEAGGLYWLGDRTTRVPRELESISAIMGELKEEGRGGFE